MKYCNHLLALLLLLPASLHAQTAHPRLLFGAGRTDAAFFLRSLRELQNWETSTEEDALVTKILNRDATETLNLRDAIPAGNGPRFLQLQVIK